jgi:hypothetical protein
MARTRLPADNAERGRPVLPWRLVAGVFLHFILPAYVIALVVDVLLFARDLPLSQMVLQALPFSGWFLLIYTAIAVLGSVLAALLDRPLRVRRAWREARDPSTPARRSEQLLTEAVRQGRGQFGHAADEVLQALRRGRWVHADARFQALSNDLAQVVRTSSAALASADPERRASVKDTALRGLRGIALGLRELELEASRHDEGDAQTVARYVEARYGSDSAGSVP